MLKARRETLALIASAVALTFVLSYAVHNRPAVITAAAPAPQQVWTGQLTDVAPTQTTELPSEPITSASLVVPALATPPLPAHPVPPTPKQRPCDDVAPCSAATRVGAVPPVRLVSTQVARAIPIKIERKDNLLGKLNPLDHIPDAMRHPLDYAGDTFSSWMKRL